MKPKKPIPLSPAMRERMQKTKRRDTGPEIALRSALHRAGLRFRIDRAPPGQRARADILFSKVRVAIFVNGCFWHGCPIHGTWPKNNADWWRAKIEGNRERDRRTDASLTQAGWSVLRVWEHDEPSVVASLVVQLVRTRRNELVTPRRRTALARAAGQS